MLNFGQRVKAIRKEAHLTQSELADKLMVSVQAVSKWECGNATPDISLLISLSAVLGVTTDFLLGISGDETADREKLYKETKLIESGIEKIYSRKDNAHFACYGLYKEHIKKYPFDYEIKLRCADTIIRIIYYEGCSADKKAKLYNEAIVLLTSVINHDRDTTRLIDAKQLLIILYLYNNDFANAEAIANGLPQKGNIRVSMEIEIYSKMNNQDKCVELAKIACTEAVHNYLWALAVKAKRLSFNNNTQKQEVIDAWYDLISGAKFNYKIFCDIKIHTKWLYSALNNLANEYITNSDMDNAFHIIEELTRTLIDDYHACVRNGNQSIAAEIKGNFKFYLHSCYNLCFSTEDNIISNNARFIKCEQLLESVQ